MVILLETLIYSGKTFQISAPEYDMLCLNNSLLGFGIVKLLIEEDLKIRELLFKIVGSNIFWIYIGAS